MAIKPKITDYNRRDEIGKPLSPMVLKKTQKQKLKKNGSFFKG